jgi:colanic acid/amylovoran biosynthesis glycosyltransferase
MKIGYILFHFPALTESFVLNEIVELIKLGHEVHIFSITGLNGQFVHKEFTENLSNSIHYLPNPKEITSQIRLVLKSIGIFGWNYPCENLKTKGLSIAAAKYFYPIAKNLQLDVLHAHFNGVPAHTAMLMSEKLLIPFTFTGHANDIFVKPSVSSLKKRMKQASAIIVPSNYNRKYLHKLTGINETKIRVVRACPLIDKFSDVKRKQKFPIVVSVGRFVEKKGIKDGILSIKTLTKFYPEIQYRIIGSGVLENELRSLANSLDISKNVVFLGNVSDDLQIDELSKATIFILPCIKGRNGDVDGIPVSLMEAMYSRIPVISTTLSGIPELIQNGKEGLLVEPGNVGQMVDAIETLLKNDDLRSKMGERGKEKIVLDFNIHKEVEKLIAIWIEISANHEKRTKVLSRRILV